MHSIGKRVLAQIEQVCAGALHRDLAEGVEMPPDAFSRAVNGKRQFSSLELVRVAEYLNADLHWLITGTPDPNRLTVAARHNFDHETGHRDVPGRNSDEQTIQDITLAYRQAYPEAGELVQLPARASQVRASLGSDFVRHFADRLEEELNVDVVRLRGLSTAYSFTVGGKRVIAIPATGNWFRENWDLAHELGHLCMQHHDEGLAADVSAKHETAANAFAADLLLPTDELEKVEWESIEDQQLADLVWAWGVSTDALARRMNYLRRSIPGRVALWAGYPTQRLLRHHLSFDSEIDEITRRMDEASQRRFPLALQEAHLENIASGSLGKGTLAWMLGIEADALEVDSPDVPEVGVDELVGALGL